MRVRFPTVSPYVLRDMYDPAVRRRVIAGQGELFLPADSGGPHPAVVIAEGLGGLKPTRELGYGQKLAGHGYVALTVDCFAARGLARAGDTRRALKVTTAMLVADAFAGLAYLCRHPAVRPDAVSIVGFSYGGMVSVLTAYEQIRQLFTPDRGPRFAGHVSYYGCSVPRLEDPTATGAPVLMFLGGRDKNVSLARSRLIAEDLRRGGAEVDVRLFESAYHQWDGADLEKRHVRFALANCRTLIDRAGHLRDERTGLRITGPLSRMAVLASCVSLRGYDILRDEDVLRQSDEVLLAFLQKLSQPNTSDRMSRPTVPRATERLS